MEGQFEDAPSELEHGDPVCSQSSSSESEVSSDWSPEEDYDLTLADYNWENETGNFSKKLAAVRSGNQPNANRKPPVTIHDHSKFASSKAFDVSRAS